MKNLIKIQLTIFSFIFAMLFSSNLKAQYPGEVITNFTNCYIAYQLNYTAIDTGCDLICHTETGLLPPSGQIANDISNQTECGLFVYAIYTVLVGTPPNLTPLTQGVIYNPLQKPPQGANYLPCGDNVNVPADCQGSPINPQVFLQEDGSIRIYLAD